jgi:hypothetical protein
VRNAATPINNALIHATIAEPTLGAMKMILTVAEKIKN